MVTKDELRQRYMPHLIKPEPAADPVENIAEETPERAFVVQSETGRTVISAPVREVASHNKGFTYLRGRFVEADTPNRNGAMWTTGDLELAQATVAGGPLNWLHDERRIIGSLLDAQMVVTREEARDFTAEQRRKMAGGAAMSDGSFPIKNAEDLRNAIRLAGKSKNPTAARRHIIRRARALGLSNLIPDTWKRETSAEVGNHIAATAAVWRYLFPQEVNTIERAAADRQLYYSMECVSEQVMCVDGCGESFDYGTYNRQEACAHLRERSSVRRFVNPIFLGGAIIVPPVRPGWANADVEVQRQAAQVAEEYGLAEAAMTRPEAEYMVQQILAWANRS